jgi:hypothetical protein
MNRIIYYTTLTPFGTRPIMSVAEVMEALGLESRRQLPKEYGRFWAVYA